MILVSHANIGGTRIEWWNEYAKALSNDKTSWKNFDQWLDSQEFVVLPNNEIPLNKEVKYGVPTPAKAVEDYEPILGIKDKDALPLTDDEVMCR